MGLFLGDSQPTKIFVGDTAISKVFLGDQQVRPSGGGGWQPGANTICYYPFENDYTDQMGNTTLSASGTQATIGFTFNVSGSGEISNGNATGKSALANQVFVSYWAMVNSHGANMQLVDATKDFYYDFYHTNSTYRKKWEYWTTSNNCTTLGPTTTTTGTWYYYAYGYDSSSSKIFAYINGVKIGESSVSGNPRTGVPRKVGSGNNSCNFTISQLIGESKCWTEQEIVDYFNQTKATYGIS